MISKYNRKCLTSISSQLIERDPDPKGGLLKGALGLIAGAAAAGAAAKAGKGAATPAAPATPASGSAAAGSSVVASTSPQSSDAAARKRIRKNRALAKKGNPVKKGEH